MEAAEVTTEDGVRLALRRFRPEGERRAVVLATHAMWANGGYFDRPAGRGFASYLSRRGFEVYVLDFRGHGRSGRPSSPWSFDDYVRFDLPAAVRRIGELSGAAAGELCWVGHSLGGLVSVAAAGVCPGLAPAKLVLATTNIWRRAPPVRRAFIELFDASARLFGRAPIRALRLGTDDEPAPYVAQLASWVRTGRFLTADGAASYDDTLPLVKAPVMVVVGGGDPLCRLGEALELAARLGSTERRTLIVSRAHGFALDATHFTLFTSPRAAPAWDELGDFLAPR
ncbi:MAG: alpha/beta fold hydrolase [Myxococcaceae bacterium]